MTFLNPFFLFGLIALAIPIALHLFDLQRPKKMIFTNVAFLKEVIQQKSSARRIKHWLILLARILFILFLVIAFAQPIINSKPIALKTTSVQVYIDNSFSMQNELEQNSLLDQAVGLSQQIPPTYNASTNFRLLTNEFSGNDWQYQSKDGFLDELTELDFNGQSRTSQEIIRRIKSSAPNSSQGTQDVFILSDFQKNYWKDLLISKPDSQFNWHLVPIQSPESLNIAVDSIWLETPFIQAGKPNKLFLRAKGYGKGKREVVFKLILNDIQLSTVSIEITGGQEYTSSFDFTVDQKDAYKGIIRFDDSPTVFDNAFYFTLNSAATIQITSLHQNDGSYVEKLYTNEKLFQVNSYSYQSIDYSKLNQSNLVVMEEYASTNKSLIQNLKQVLAKGGNVALYPPSNGDWTAWQDFLKDLSISVKPTSLTDSIGKQSWYIQYPDTDQPFYEGVFLDKKKMLTEMPFSIPLFETVSPGTVLLRYKQGTPFLTQIASGKGNVYVFSGCLKDHLSSFQRHSLFVPVMYSIAFDALAQKNQLYYRTTDKTIAIKNNEPITGQIQLMKDSISWLPIQNIREGEIVMELPEEIKLAGFYDIKYYKLTINTLAINYGRGESDGTAILPTEIEEWAKDQTNVHVIDAVNQLDFSDDLKSLKDGKPLWKYCIILALFFLLTEILLLRFLK